jgi:hypothetical protein
MDGELRSWADLDDDDYDSLARNIGINNDLVTPRAARDAAGLVPSQARPLTIERLRPIGYMAALGVLVAWFVELTIAFLSSGPSVALGSMFAVDVTTLARLVYKSH